MPSKIRIIAEAGVNHNGDMDMARRLVEAAAEAGADMVKFQTYRTEALVTRSAVKADYQKRAMGGDESQFEMLKRYELTEADHGMLMAHCRACGIAFLSTAFDLGSIDLLARLGLQTYKIPSGEITNLPYLRRIGRLNQEVILSTGMAGLGEIEQAVAALIEAGAPSDGITLLHCNTAYPTPMADVNLLAMRTLAEAFHLPVGYSDHTPGIEIPIAAAALGAAIVEKHFTLDRNLPGPDHAASLEPEELKAMVRAARNVEAALGDGRKAPSPSERLNMAIARKSIVAARPIRKGAPLTEDNLTVKRPGGGINPMRWDEVVGRTADRDYQADEPIRI